MESKCKISPEENEGETQQDAANREVISPPCFRPPCLSTSVQNTPSCEELQGNRRCERGYITSKLRASSARLDCSVTLRNLGLFRDVSLSRSNLGGCPSLVGGERFPGTATYLPFGGPPAFFHRDRPHLQGTVEISGFESQSRHHQIFKRWIVTGDLRDRYT